MKRVLCILFVALVVGQGAVVLAQYPNVNQRQHRQQQRIRSGFRSEELTRGEFARLQAQQGRIRAFERRSRCDGGGLSLRERRRLDNMLDRSNRSIYRQNHDRQDR
ncbi:MAG TPA: hypothetical protein VG778_05665 [Blastocatellia bacterium]|jgi:hypothetical protein|nr:hypothetical protein [Blastocatellia bacterium]